MTDDPIDPNCRGSVRSVALALLLASLGAGCATPEQPSRYTTAGGVERYDGQTIDYWLDVFQKCTHSDPVPEVDRKRCVTSSFALREFEPTQRSFEVVTEALYAPPRKRFGGPWSALTIIKRKWAIVPHLIEPSTVEQLGALLTVPELTRMDRDEILRILEKLGPRSLPALPGLRYTLTAPPRARFDFAAVKAMEIVETLGAKGHEAAPELAWIAVHNDNAKIRAKAQEVMRIVGADPAQARAISKGARVPAGHEEAVSSSTPPTRPRSSTPPNGRGAGVSPAAEPPRAASGPPQPSTSQVRTAVTAALQRNVPVTWVGNLGGGKNARLQTVEIVRVGIYNEQLGYWPLKVRVAGVCELNDPLNKGKTVSFDKVADFIFSRDDYGDWKAELRGGMFQ